MELYTQSFGARQYLCYTRKESWFLKTSVLKTPVKVRRRRRKKKPHRENLVTERKENWRALMKIENLYDHQSYCHGRTFSPVKIVGGKGRHEVKIVKRGIWEDFGEAKCRGDDVIIL
ncbi:hypothetical protein LEMLEM_LOCUS1064 [Lemmus lemmus]